MTGGPRAIGAGQEAGRAPATGTVRADRPGDGEAGGRRVRRAALAIGGRFRENGSLHRALSRPSATAPREHRRIVARPRPIMAFDPRHRSQQILDGRDRAPARAMLKAIGFDDEALSRPIIGIANTWIETMPCNYPPPRPGGAREAGHPRRRRHADGVQHRRHQRRDHHGHRGDEGQPRQPRGDRRLDRAGRPRPHASTPSSAWPPATRRSPAARWAWSGSTCPAWSSTAARSPRAGSRATT